jgi:tripartite-type tricarboxylate transporter receptor subunit TctC
MHRAARLFLIPILSCAASGASAADAASDYPNRPLRFIAPFVAGGPSDILSRLLGQKLTEAWGQPVIVDNRGSAGGIVGFEIGAQAPPDGYTMVLATSAGLTINPSVYKKLSYDPVRDFQPITQVTSGPYLMVVHPSVAAKSVPEFIALAKSKPGQLNFATTGTNNLLAMEQLNHMAGIKTIPINYKGTGQAVNAIVSGEVQSFIINPLVGAPQVKAGKLRAIAVTSAKRSPAFPDVPAIAETLPGFEQTVWHSVIVPVRTPKPIVSKLSGELVRILRLPDVKDRFNREGLDAVGNTPEEVNALIKREIVMYSRRGATPTSAQPAIASRR